MYICMFTLVIVFIQLAVFIRISFHLCTLYVLKNSRWKRISRSVRNDRFWYIPNQVDFGFGAKTTLVALKNFAPLVALVNNLTVSLKLIFGSKNSRTARQTALELLTFVSHHVLSQSMPEKQIIVKYTELSRVPCYGKRP